MKNAQTIIWINIFALFACTHDKVLNNKNDLMEQNLNGSIKTIIESTYNLIEKDGEINKGSIEVKRTYKYDKMGNMLEEQMATSKFKLRLKHSNKYDNKGNITEKILIDQDDKDDTEIRYTFIYNDKGDVLETNEYNTDGILSKKFTFEYDKQGNLLVKKEKNLPNDWIGYKYIYKYDEIGNAIESKKIGPDGKVELQYTYSYDEMGNVIEQNRYFAMDGSETRHSYNYDDFDENNNWRHKEVYQNGQPVYIIEREIEYYNIGTQRGKGNQPTLKRNQNLAKHDFIPIFTVIDTTYTPLTQEMIAKELEYLKNSNIIDNRIPYFLEGIQRKLSTAETKGYSTGKDLTENIIIEFASDYVTDEVFKEAVDSFEKYVNSYLAEGYELKLIEVGRGSYMNTHNYKYMIVYNSYFERYTYQYYFNFSQRTYSITINSKRQNIIIDKLIGIEKRIKNDLTKENIKGKVKVIIESVYTTTENKGNPKKNALSSKYTYMYDKHGNLIENDIYFTLSVLRDKNGKVIYKYNDEGVNIEREIYDQNGLLKYKEICRYDDMGNRVQEDKYNTAGQLDSKRVNRYDGYGNIIEMNRYKQDGTLKLKEISKYNLEGKEIERTTYNPEIDIRWREAFKYDVKGNEIEVSAYTSDGNPYYTRTNRDETFDLNGNWLLRVTYNDDKPLEIIERVIEYYQ